MTPILFEGMHGLGDSLHERAIVRELKKAHEVWVRTSWPSAYWDMPDLHLLPLDSPIPWMAKNEMRCASLYSTESPPPDARTVRCAYPWADAQVDIGAGGDGQALRRGGWRLPAAGRAGMGREVGAPARPAQPRPAAADHPAAADDQRPAQSALGAGQARAQSGSDGLCRAARRHPRAVFRDQRRRCHARS